MSINTITTEDLRRMEGKEGLVLQGCGGDLQEWLDGINEMFTGAGILKDNTKFRDISSFENDGLTCLLYPFEDVKLNMGQLAMWRLQTYDNFGGTWLSDYVPNRLGGFIGEPVQEQENRLRADRTGWEHLQPGGDRIPDVEGKRDEGPGKGDGGPCVCFRELL